MTPPSTFALWGLGGKSYSRRWICLRYFQWTHHRSYLPAGLLIACVLCFGPSAASQLHRALLEEAESAFRDYRYYDDQVSITRARNAQANLEDVPLQTLTRQRDVLSARLQTALDELGTESSRWSDEDWRAIAAMRGALAVSGQVSSPPPAVPCDYDPDALASHSGAPALRERLYACFGRAAENISFRGRKLDRLGILFNLSLTEDARTRREMFMALRGVWSAVNSNNTPSSPYRTMVRYSARSWQEDPLEKIARQAGLDLETLEAWIVSALEKWRSIGPREPVEPWDFDYVTSRAARDLSPRIRSRRHLERLRDRYYGALVGSSPAALGIHFDLEPRPGKDPVAYATFGRRSSLDGQRWSQGEFWVFASYRTGNLESLSELLHETGHGIHMAGIRSRPAFQDWPDSDAFTEALADMTAHEAYEPEWQRRYLGIRIPLARSLEEKYSSMAMDLAWGLFEIRMYRNPASDPNRIWTEIATKYLNIQPHPEISWWAVRGQLVNSPGYMLTYAVAGFMTAVLRARTKELRGEDVFWNPPRDLYPWLSEKLYRFGLERPAIRVLEDYLGGVLRPEPLLRDMERAVP